jgi:DNA-binding transcriptional MocR family regulator
MSASCLATRARLSEVRYEIRGELSRRARELEAQGRTLIKLNIGNPGAFGFRAPEHLQRAIADGIAHSDPYTHQQGLPVAREAIAAFQRSRGTPDASPERVFIGNGVSELIDLSLRALLNPATKCCCPRPTIHCGRQPPSSTTAARAITVAVRTTRSCRSGRDRSAGDAAHARHRADQPEQSDRRGVSARPCSNASSPLPRATGCC